MVNEKPFEYEEVTEGKPEDIRVEMSDVSAFVLSRSSWKNTRTGVVSHKVNMKPLFKNKNGGWQNQQDKEKHDIVYKLHSGYTKDSFKALYEAYSRLIGA